ncbi:hypothetical protein ACFQ0G_38080 [Streptomyces chiangmaiensis]
MSTEARRASIPPRPTTPPRPSTPPGEPRTQPDHTPPAPQDPPRAAWREGTPGAVPPRPEQPPAVHGADAPRVPSARASSLPAPSREQAPRAGTRAQADAPARPAVPPRTGGALAGTASGPSAADGPSGRLDAKGSPQRPGDTPPPESGDAPQASPPRTPESPASRTCASTGTPSRTARPRRRLPRASPTGLRRPVPLRGAPMRRPCPRRAPLPAEGIVETTVRLRPHRDENGPVAPRPFVTVAQPDTHTIGTWRRPGFGTRVHPRAAAAAACLVLGLGLIGGAVTGSWLTGDGSGDGARDAFAVTGGLWHSVPVDRLFPPTINDPGAGPGGADRTWTRVAVAPDGTCKAAFDPLLRKALAPVGCLRLLRATYTDATGSHVTTVGLLFTRADAAAMAALNSRFKKEGLDRRTDLMPRPYAAKGTVAAKFGDAQRASWTISVLTDAPVVVYAVSGFADGRTVTEPQFSAQAMATGATTASAQAGLGFEAAGLADRVEAALRKTVTSVTEKPS